MKKLIQNKKDALSDKYWKAREVLLLAGDNIVANKLSVGRCVHAASLAREAFDLLIEKYHKIYSESDHAYALAFKHYHAISEARKQGKQQLKKRKKLSR